MIYSVLQTAQGAMQEVSDSLSVSGPDGGQSLFDTLMAPGNRLFTISLIVILLIGIFLISMRLYALWSDRKRGSRLYAMEFRESEAESVAQAVEKETHHLLSEIFATMLNVFQTQGSAETLHAEVTNFVAQKQDEFASFKLRIDFLSDTAGAIGLLGTVWGIIVVFNGGVEDKDLVLAGMGVALTSTLVGLIVSLVLNLCVTEVNTYFDRLLNRAIDKADILRFRLMELANQEVVTTASVPSASGCGGTTSDSTEVTTFGRRINPGTRLDMSAQKSGRSKATKIAHKILLASKLPEVPAGATLRGLLFRVVDESGEPVPQCPVDFKTANGKARSSLTKDDGSVAFDWTVNGSVGIQKATASIKETNISYRVELSVIKPKPSSVEVIGNNQSGKSGALLSKPIGVKLSMRSGKPLANHPVSFSVEMGSGSIGKKQSPKFDVLSDASGRAFTELHLGKEPGFNVVIVHVEGVEERYTVQAMGSEG